MKKLFKILGYLFLLVFLIGIGFAIFLNGKYNHAAAAIKKEQIALSNAQVEFYRFQLNQAPPDQPAILPVPKIMSWTSQSFQWPDNWRVHSPEQFPKLMTWIERLTNQKAANNTQNANLVFVQNKNLTDQGYELDVETSQVKIGYKSEVGLYYGLTTLSQLQTLYPGSVNGLHIEDEPDLEIRGVMLDISRDKVPTLKTLLGIVDQLAKLKFNHLQLYVEGFSFAYPSFKRHWEGKETPITPEEIQQLDRYCKERFIDLAANQNSLGHMAAWLETEEFADLAECPDGFGLMPMMKMKTTLSPQDPRSIELVKQMMDDIIPSFSSAIFNANLDEPFELGHCKSEALAKEIGVGQIYLDYVKQVYQHAQTHQKEFWMWGDIVGKHPEIIDQLPKDITVLEWGYEHEHPYNETTTLIKEAGLDFLVCPGTSSWMSLTGRTENMLGNISNAARNGVTNGAKGMLLTDWGDMGHWQYLPVSFAGFAYAGGVSWNVSSDQNLPLEHYLNTFVFEDEKNKMGAIALDMGRFSQFEEMEGPNMNMAFMAYQFGLVDPVLENAILGGMKDMVSDIAGPQMLDVIENRFNNKKSFDYNGLNEYLNQIENDLNEPEMSLEQVNVIKDEFSNGIRMVRLGSMLKNYNAQKENWTAEDRATELKNMKTMIVEVQAEHRRLWLLRNKSGGLDRSLKAFQGLETSIDQQIKVMEGSGLGKGFNRLKEKIISGGANWYLD